MNKKIYSLIIITITALYVTFSINLNNIELKNIPVYAYLNKFADNISFSRLLNVNKNTKIQYNEVKQTSQFSINENSDSMKNNINAENLTTNKKDKITSNPLKINRAEKEMINDGLVDSHTGTIKTNGSQEYSKVRLSDLERSKLMDEAMKLSTVDQNRAISLIEDGNETSIKSVISIFKERLSDKEFESIKSIEIKYDEK